MTVLWRAVCRRLLKVLVMNIGVELTRCQNNVTVFDKATVTNII
jgi:hypothetical protein